MGPGVCIVHLPAGCGGSTCELLGLPSALPFYEAETGHGREEVLLQIWEMPSFYFSVLDKARRGVVLVIFVAAVVVAVAGCWFWLLFVVACCCSC